VTNEASNQPNIKHNKAIGIPCVVHNQSHDYGYVVGMYVYTAYSYTVF
jgi:hypothetical protein